MLAFWLPLIIFEAMLEVHNSHGDAAEFDYSVIGPPAWTSGLSI